MQALFSHLTRYSPDDWRQAVDTLNAEIHPIDRNATRIWFAFYPLELHLLLKGGGNEQVAALAQAGGAAGTTAEEAEAGPTEAVVARRLGLMGRWRLADQIDSSHRFLYAHRYWPQVKLSITTTDEFPERLPALIAAVADAATRRARVDREMLLGITAAGLMTLRQAGPEAFAAAPGKIHLSDKARALSPHQVMVKRAHDDWQGLMGFTRGINKRWTVTFDEADPAATFPVISGQEIASAAQNDKRDYRSREPRCTPGEGPIPVECRAASCGTCWVGLLGGAEKLSPVVTNDEGRRMDAFGYGESDGATPLIRLSCQAKAFGAVSIVIPPWNGIFGRALRRSTP